MREILFRGKMKYANGDIQKGSWVFGDLANLKDGKRTLPHIYGFGEIIPETVGEYTGLTDKNGVEAFEGDIIKHPLEEEIGVIKYGKYKNPFNDDCSKHIGFYVEWLSARDDDFLKKDLGYWLNISEIIGNIYDNPELMKGEEQK